jgi:hydroxymethylbilane synthase
VSQGAVGVECLADNEELASVLAALADDKTWQCVRAERALNLKLNGSCSVAIGALATYHLDDTIALKAGVFSPDGTRTITARQQGYDPVQLGEYVANELLGQGAEAILAMAD